MPRTVEDYKNFIRGDPVLDLLPYMEFEKDKSEYSLADYIVSTKEKFFDKIKSRINTAMFNVETCRGIIDIIILTSDIEKTFNIIMPGSGFSVFTVEYSSLDVDKKNKLRNTEKQRYYLFKNWLLTKSLVNERKLKIDGSYIIGRRYSSSQTEIYNNAFLLAENTHSFQELLFEGDAHFQKLKNNQYVIGENVFPNMKNTMDFPWRGAKKVISKKINEISSMWRCSFKYREELHLQGITSYKNIVNYPTNVIKNMINNKKKLYIPFRATMPVEKNQMFIDFEILTNVYDDLSEFPKSNEKSYIFNIGCGYTERNNFRFKSWVAYSLGQEEEIIRDFITFLETREDIVLCHWTDIEKRYLLNSVQKYNIVLKRPLSFFDLCGFFINSEIVVLGCKSYKLKEVAGSLYKNGLISSKWDTGSFSDGIKAMTGYIRYLENGDLKTLRKIAEYNRIDCKVLWEIWKLL